MAHGAFWMVLFKLLERSIGLVSTVILVRLLLPADFGLVAMATSIIAVLELLGALNFDAALIQNPNAERRHYDTAFTFNVLFGSVCALLLLLLAWPAAGFYNEPRLTPVIAWLALSTWIGGFENIGVVAFRKNMRFDQEFKFLLAKKLIAFAVTVSLAFALRSYWALVVGMVTSRACGVVISYFSQAYRPRLTLSARHELLHFSRWLLLNNILFFLVQDSSGVKILPEKSTQIITAAMINAAWSVNGI
jgi:O-antigen/teichoic acid export membrane protein